VRGRRLGLVAAARGYTSDVAQHDEKEQRRAVNELEHTQDLATRLAVQYGPRILSALVVLLVGYVVATWAGKLTVRGLGRFALEPPVRELIVRIARLAVFLLFLVMALQNLGIELLPLVAGLGIAGAGVALALQGVLGNIAAGLTIIFTRPFRIGEYISIAGEEGEVLTITLFSTTLRHTDLSLVVIPNRKIAGEILHNYGMIRQLALRISLARAADIDAATGAIREVLASNPRVLADPVALIQTALLGEWSVTLVAKPWVPVTDYEAAIGELNAGFARALRERGVQLQTAAVLAPPRRDASDDSGANRT
jgi:small conductance mechanosensitive channel